MKMFFGFILTILALFCSQSVLANDSDWDLLKHFASSYGDRFAGSPREHSAAKWLTEQYEFQGLEVKQYPFRFFHSDRVYRSKNLEVELKGKSEKVLIIGAHYDSIGQKVGSTGFIDNASGTITLLALAKRLKNKDIPFSIRFVSFGAEELGLHGSKEYVSSINVHVDQIIGMINLDTVFGGDNLYIHSAHSIPYKCREKNAPNYSSSTWLRDELLSESKKLTNISSYLLHAATTGYPEGETGGWSD
ncbi:M28 family peptidase, partial [Vibrio sp. 10N.261.52.A1]